MTRLMLILSALAAVLLIATPVASACENCGCQKAKAEKVEKAKGCAKDCDCPGCKAKKAKAKDCQAGCDCPACKAKADKSKKAHAGCDCSKKGAHADCGCSKKGSHAGCPHAKKSK